MAGEPELKTCADCGATIYPEHLERRLAVESDGKLLCAHCWQEQRAATGGSATAAAARLSAADPAAPGREEALVLAAEESGASDARESTAIRAFGGGLSGAAQGAARVRQVQLRRPLMPGTPNATRCRSFHCKLTDAAVAHMNDQINEWADGDDGIEIKFATSCIGVIEGKHADPHMIVTVFY
jgi:hypothetical protein